MTTRLAQSKLSTRRPHGAINMFLYLLCLRRRSVSTHETNPGFGVRANCLTDWKATHELGHMLGCAHHRTPDSPDDEYNFGLVQCAGDKP